MWWLFALLACGPQRDGPPDTDPPTDSDPVVSTAETGLEPVDLYALAEPWVVIEGGTFTMGTAPPAPDWREEPAITVHVPTFAIMRHEITVEQYQACVAAGVCMPRDTACTNQDLPQRPATCLDWLMADQFCAWFGGRLPTESEWEFAASSRGMDVTYPWGNEPVSCDRANSGLTQDGPSCDGEGTWEVCTHPLGDTPLGLCEMGGNVFEWLADYHRDYYFEHPTDGSAQTIEGGFRSMRGGSIGSDQNLRIRQRTYHPPDFRFGGMGARCAVR